MDPIEEGFNLLVKRIEESTGKEELIEEIKRSDVALLSRMAKTAKPLIPRIGLNMLQRGKQDTKGDLYDVAFTKKKMIVLGKTDQAGSRPDNPAMKVEDQFCVFDGPPDVGGHRRDDGLMSALRILHHDAAAHRLMFLCRNRRATPHPDVVSGQGHIGRGGK